MEKFKITTANACYSGGGIYIYWGRLSNGNWFVADDSCDFADIVNEDPSANDFDNLTYEWFEEHLVETKSKVHVKEIIKAVIKEQPQGNYLTEELNERLSKRTAEGENAKNYRKRKEAARQEAIEWTEKYFTSDTAPSLSWGELAEWQDHFRKLGKKYGLLREFKENGIC